MIAFATIAFAGLAFGVVLFLMASGLSVTMGLMGFANLAHAAFAMFGAYLVVTLMNAHGWPFFATLPVAFVATALVATVFERVLFRRLYRSSQLEQVMLTIGLVFMATAGAVFFFGGDPQAVNVPAWLSGDLQAGGAEINRYRLFLVIFGALLIVALILGIEHTTFGAKLRAAVDDRRATASCGINVDRLFMTAFFLGSGLAGLGGALSIPIVGLDPNFGLTFLASILIVVTLGGLGSLRGTLAAALVLGIADAVGKYYVPWAGAFIIYAVTVALLLWRPQGLLATR
ncbi:MAG TPA: branched-chain amino acid ABC transporter permease [Candidatus Elarobacter sp.]|nr:branched-chain amino acid ABC transporter permease [Candidatus Elarobacter sp.]